MKTIPYLVSHILLFYNTLSIEKNQYEKEEFFVTFLLFHCLYRRASGAAVPAVRCTKGRAAFCLKRCFLRERKNSIFLSKKEKSLFTFTLLCVSMYLVKIGTSAGKDQIFLCTECLIVRFLSFSILCFLPIPRKTGRLV